MLRLNRPADEGGESAAAVLLFTNALQMLDPVFNRLDMTEHHCGARSHSELPCDLHHLRPLAAVNFQFRNPFPHALNNMLASAPRTRSHPRTRQFTDHPPHNHTRTCRP